MKNSWEIVSFEYEIPIIFMLYRFKNLHEWYTTVTVLLMLLIASEPYCSHKPQLGHHGFYRMLLYLHLSMSITTVLMLIPAHGNKVCQ